MDGVNACLNKLNDNFDSIYLGFSGGLDSCVLLHLLCQHEKARRKLTVIHINHNLSPHAADWALWAQTFCKNIRLPFQSFSVSLDSDKNLEESARNKRYDIFHSLLKTKRDVVLLAHHQNDQAETLLLHLFRGAGIDGLAVMPEWRSLGQGYLYRPLLNFSRAELESYAAQKKLTWIEDESNTNQRFDRNFLRQNIIPQLQKRWPALINNLARSAKHCAIARKMIEQQSEELLTEIMDDRNRLNIHLLQQHSAEVQMTLLRQWLKKQHFKIPNQEQLEHILNGLIPAAKDAQPLIAWKSCEIRRYQGWLYALNPLSLMNPLNLTNPQGCSLPLGGKILCSSSVPLGGGRLGRGGDQIEIRFRQGGEKMRLNGKNHALKKLFQAWKIPPWERDKIPLIYINNELACVQGWMISDGFKTNELLSLPNTKHPFE